MFLLGRLLFGATLAFTGVNRFLDVEGMAGYAAHKGVPAPKAATIASGALLVLGGASIVLGIATTIRSLALAAFLLATTITMHDFWNAEGEAAQNEMTAFLKNVYGAGGALAFAAIGTVAWPYAVNLGAF